MGCRSPVPSLLLGGTRQGSELWPLPEVHIHAPLFPRGRRRAELFRRSRPRRRCAPGDPKHGPRRHRERVSAVAPRASGPLVPRRRLGHVASPALRPGAETSGERARPELRALRCPTSGSRATGHRGQSSRLFSWSTRSQPMPPTSSSWPVGSVRTSRSMSYSPSISTGPALLPRTVESIAHRCWREIRQVQPHGPFLIGGRSFGAVVAYEIAFRLESAGEKVELLHRHRLRRSRCGAPGTSRTTWSTTP